MNFNYLDEQLQWVIPARITINQQEYNLLDIAQVSISKGNSHFGIVSFDNIDDVEHIDWEEYDEIHRRIKQHMEDLCWEEKDNTFTIQSCEVLEFEHPLLYPEKEYLILMNNDWAVRIGKRGASMRPMVTRLDIEDIYIQTARFKNLTSMLKEKLDFLDVNTVKGRNDMKDIIVAYCHACQENTLEQWFSQLNQFRMVHTIVSFEDYQKSHIEMTQETDLVL